jgi:hypothetical protein
VTSEQLIILGFVVLAYTAGWATHALTARRHREDRTAWSGALPARPPRYEWPALVDEVSDALRSDAANDSMLSVQAGGAGLLTELELDLTDWGFTYGVAWARARERWPSAPDEMIAREALRAADAVFGAYAEGSSWKRRAAERPSPVADGLAEAMEPRQ